MKYTYPGLWIAQNTSILLHKACKDLDTSVQVCKEREVQVSSSDM